MIKLKKINDVLNLIGKYIRNDKNNKTYLIAVINANKYKEQDDIKYLIQDKNKVVLSGTEEEIYKMLLNWTVI